MAEIYLTSDTHFNHNKDFIYERRGFKSIEEMNEKIIENWNSIVKPEDTVYHLGDVMLGDIEAGINCLKRLNGHVYIAIGNHDTQARIRAYAACRNVEAVEFGYRIKQGKKTCILTHYPTITNNVDNVRVPNFYGHTHQSTNFYNHILYLYILLIHLKESYFHQQIFPVQTLHKNFLFYMNQKDEFLHD